MTELFKEYNEIQELLKGVLGEKKFAKFFPLTKYQTPRDFRVSIVCLIETQDYTIFQSEPHRVDKVTLPRGIQVSGMIERTEAHESKIKQEIRRVGKRLERKLLNPEEITKGTDTTSDEERECHIPDCLCGNCRDCRLWGFAARPRVEAGEEQGQPSKVDVGTTFTIRAVDEFLTERIWNAVDESDRKVNQAFGDKEQIPPQVFLPYVIDVRDGSFDEFLYLLYSILNAKRVGAGRTKYGSVEITPIGFYFAYEQLFSNKRLVQNCYDYLWKQREQTLDDNKKRLGWLGELSQNEVQEALLHATDKELEKANCWYTSIETHQPEKANNLNALLNKAKVIFRNEDNMKKIVSVKPK